MTGWVRNERDGSVTALIAGPKGKVSRMVDALWEGPGAASVNYVATEEYAGDRRVRRRRRTIQ